MPYQLFPHLLCTRFLIWKGNLHSTKPCRSFRIVLGACSSVISARGKNWRLERREGQGEREKEKRSPAWGYTERMGCRWVEDRTVLFSVQYASDERMLSEHPPNVRCKHCAKNCAGGFLSCAWPLSCAQHTLPAPSPLYQLCQRQPRHIITHHSPIHERNVSAAHRPSVSPALPRQ